MLYWQAKLDIFEKVRSFEGGNLMKIKNFIVENSLGNYNMKQNLEKLSIYDLSPDSVSWTFHGEDYEIKDNDKIHALLLKDKEKIAVIKGLFGKNDVFIVNGKNKIIWHVKKLFLDLKLFPPRVMNIVFTDIYYCDTDLFFFVNTNNIDYRFNFDLNKGIIGQLIESR